MRAAQVVVQGRRSRKSVRLAMLLGVLLTVSIAVNVMIILADGSRL